MSHSPEVLLREMFDAAVAQAQPALCIPKFLPEPPKGRTIVIGAGKASAAMAHAFEQNWRHDVEGLVVTRYGYFVKCDRIEIMEAAHPVPDKMSRLAARRILQLVENLTKDDLVVCLISGGGSSLLSLPVDSISFKDKQLVNQALLRSGATINEMNCVRKHISAVKGGQLAMAASPARVISLLISDVPGDDPASIASGPTVGDESTFEQAREIVNRYQLQLPSSVISYLTAGVTETPCPENVVFGNYNTQIIAAPQLSLMAAVKVAEKAGYKTLVLGDSIEGESRDVALVHAGIAQQVLNHGQPINSPCVLLSGGETTVSVRGHGRGGRNAEFALALAIALNQKTGIWSIVCDTDGVDGTEDNAGALITPDTLIRARAKGINPREFLENNDGYSFFDRLGDLVITGPTLTNVNDFRAILIHP